MGRRGCVADSEGSVMADERSGNQSGAAAKGSAAQLRPEGDRSSPQGSEMTLREREEQERRGHVTSPEEDMGALRPPPPVLQNELDSTPPAPLPINLEPVEAQRTPAPIDPFSGEARFEESFERSQDFELLLTTGESD